MSPEEFFMYLTIGLVIAVPIAVRVYRRLTVSRTTEMLRQELRQPAPVRDVRSPQGQSEKLS